MARPSALSRSGGSGTDQGVRIESADFHRLFVATRDADTVLYRELRKAMRAAGKPIVDDVRAEIDKIPSSGRYRTGIRTALKAGTRVSISNSPRTAGIRIVTSPSRLPASKRALAKTLNQPRFRHPLFGGATFVEQSGRPYFGAVIGRHKADVTRRIAAVMDDMGKRLERQVERG